MSDDCDCKRDGGGVGCLGVVIIVLVVLWLTGYFNRPQAVTVTTETHKEAGQQ